MLSGVSFWRGLILSINHFLSLRHIEAQNEEKKELRAHGWQHVVSPKSPPQLAVKEIYEISPTLNRLEPESSSDGEEKQMSDWTAGTDGTDDLDTEWYSGN